MISNDQLKSQTYRLARMNLKKTINTKVVYRLWVFLQKAMSLIHCPHCFHCGEEGHAQLVSRYPRRVSLSTASSQFVHHEIGQQKMPQVIYSKPLWLMWKATWLGLAETEQSEQSERETCRGRQGSRDFGVLKYVEVQALHYTVDSTKDTCLAVGSVFVCNTGIQAI